MTDNNPKQPEVTQADLAAVARLPFTFTTDQMQLDLIKAFSEHRIAAERATRERVLEEAARKAEHSCYDYGNTIEPSINDNGSKAFGFGFDYACEVIAAAIRAMKEEPKP